MHNSLIATGIALMLLAVAAGVGAHPMTERFIPIGKSPGLSGKVTLIGVLRDVRPGDRAITIGVNGQVTTARVTQATYIWLDRSAVGRANGGGGFSDLKIGSQVEVKFIGNQAGGGIEWVKIEMP